MNLPITDIDVIKTAPDGTKWMLEEKTITGYWKDNITEMTEIQKQAWIQKNITEGLDDLVACLQSKNPVLTDYFGTNDPATLMNMFNNGQIRLGLENTPNLSRAMSQSIRFRIMRGIRNWENANGALVGSHSVGIKLP